MLHQSYSNTTLGRDLLNSKGKLDAAFIIHHDEGEIGIVTNDHYFVKNMQITKEELMPMHYDTLSTSQAQRDSIKNHLSQLTSALYETAKWMLVNNRDQ
jgi:hypothetical protein